MINEQNVKQYCKDDISLIENYDKAISDTIQTWECHHRFETKCPVYQPTMQDLKDWELYYNRPASELIFLTNSEHMRLHNKGKHLSEDTKQKISEGMKGKSLSDETKRKIGKTLSMKILCVETGEVFESTREAYRKTGISQGNISSACNGKRKTAGGYHWKYEE